MNVSSSLQLLRAEQYAALDRELSDVQVAFERGERSERDLRDAFAPFERPDPALGEKCGEWVEACPGSYAAHVALAKWCLSRAWAFRGHTTFNLVSDRGRRGMRHFLEQAEGCARHATTMTDHPLTAWLVVAQVHLTQGCEMSLQDVQAGRYPDWFTRPLADNPHSFEVRQTMLAYLRTEWGGSEEQMLTFVRQQQEAGLLGAAEMQRLWAEFHALVAHHFMAFAQDPAGAVERARLAADLRELQAGSLFVALTNAKAPVLERQAALERLLRAAENEPGNALEGNVAWALYVNRDWLESFLPRITALLVREAERGDPDAAITLGRLKLYIRKGRVPDPTAFLRAARDEGNCEAAELLVELGRKSEGASRHGASGTSAQEREDVYKAAQLGSEDMSWEVYSDFDAYRAQFELSERDRYRYLLRAADAGNNAARYVLAQRLRAGLVEVGDDGVLRPVDTPPLQDSLNYAKHLLERAAAEDHAPAQKALAAAQERDWQEKTARRLSLSSARAEPERQVTSGQAVSKPLSGGSRWSWWLGLSLVLGVLRACTHQDHGYRPNTVLPNTPPALSAALTLPPR